MYVTFMVIRRPLFLLIIFIYGWNTPPRVPMLLMQNNFNSGASCAFYLIALQASGFRCIYPPEIRKLIGYICSNGGARELGCQQSYIGSEETQAVSPCYVTGAHTCSNLLTYNVPHFKAEGLAPLYFPPFIFLFELFMQPSTQIYKDFSTIPPGAQL